MTRILHNFPLYTRKGGKLCKKPVQCVSVSPSISVEFVSKGYGGYRPSALARFRTGRDLKTGKLSLGVALRERNNGTVRIDIDLWRIGYNLSSNAQERLWNYWQTMNEQTPPRMRKRMEHHFGATSVCFDVLAEQVDDWRTFLAWALSDGDSYVKLEPQRKEAVSH